MFESGKYASKWVTKFFWSTDDFSQRIEIFGQPHVSDPCGKYMGNGEATKHVIFYLQWWCYLIEPSALSDMSHVHGIFFFFSGAFRGGKATICSSQTMNFPHLGQITPGYR